MRRMTHGPVDGRTVLWNDEEGWGALASDDVEGEVWAHFSNVNGTGYRTLRPGQRVRFTYETPGQDGYPHRAITIDSL